MINLPSGFSMGGVDVENYCHKSKEEKVTFIMSLCGVSEKAAKDFVSKPIVHTDGKACCGGHKHESHETNIAKGNEPKASKSGVVGKDKK